MFPTQLIIALFIFGFLMIMYRTFSKLTNKKSTIFSLDMSIAISILLLIFSYLNNLGLVSMLISFLLLMFSIGSKIRISILKRQNK